MSKRKFFFIVVVVSALCLLWLKTTDTGLAAPFWPPTFNTLQTTGDNILINGDMDDDNYRFYWRPTNHFVAGNWYEWWVGDNVPEYIDGGIPYHNVCYPPPPNRHCYDYHLNYYNLSQGYIRWGGPYIAGIYQVVNNVEPCTLYEFQAYNRNDGNDYHPKVGIDVLGWQLPIPDWENLPNNCPPDGHSKCPNPKLNSVNEFPESIVWSAEGTQDIYKWASISVQAEALSSTISVWTYAAPDGSSESLSTYWDATTLVQVPFPDNKLPEPDSWTPSNFIYNVTTRVFLDSLIIEWDTLEPASTQVWFGITPYYEPYVPYTGTMTVSQVLYLPLITRDPVEYPYYIAPNYTPKTHHVARLHDLHDGDTIHYLLLSRRLNGAACTTEIYGPVDIKINITPIMETYLPITVKDKH